MLVKASARSKAPLVLMGCQIGEHKHDPRLLEAPWRTTAMLVPMLCQPGAPIITRHEPILVQAFASTQASLVLMV